MQGLEFTLLRMALVLYALGFAAALVAAVFGRRGAIGTALAGAGLAAHSASLAVRGWAQGHAPIASLYELVSGGAWFSVATVLIVFAARRERSPGTLAAVLALSWLAMGAAFLHRPDPSVMTPGLMSFWLYIHVFFALLAYGCYAVACGVGITDIIKGGAAGDPDVEARIGLQRRLVLLGFVATSAFIAAGAVWAHYAWGRYWGWDPVEAASLATWAIYGIHIHLGYRARWRGRRLSWLAVCAFPVVLLCFWLLPFVMSETVHTYEGM